MNCWSKSLVLKIIILAQMVNSGSVKHDGASKKGNMPLQAKTNGLQLCPIPNLILSVLYFPVCLKFRGSTNSTQAEA